MIMRNLSAYLLICFAIAYAGCASEGEVAESPNADAGNMLMADSGKADSVPYAVTDHFLHNKELPTDDLTRRLAVLATDELNALLSASPFLDISLGVPRLFGPETTSVAGVPIDSLPELVSGLTARYGESDFATSKIGRAHV